MKLRQDSKTFILYTYKYTSSYVDCTKAYYILFDLIPKHKRPVVTYKMQEKAKRSPFTTNTRKIFRCYKNMQLSLSLGRIINCMYTINIKVLQLK